MKNLWAPWRIDYIKEEKEEGCVFCEKPRESNDRENLILHRDKTSFIILNRFPYANGHLMVVPYKHTSNTQDLSGEEMAELMKLVNLSIELLKVISPEGYNVGMNLGRAAGAGIDDHIHFHIVPRWVGDNNFMPVLGEIRVVPEYLDRTYEKLEERLHSILKA